VYNFTSLPQMLLLSFLNISGLWWASVENPAVMVLQSATSYIINRRRLGLTEVKSIISSAA
jgi:hypothetical protein